MQDLSKNETLIIEAIAKLPQEQWYKIDDIVRLSGLKSSEIRETINKSEVFVSSIDDNQQPIITTRAKFRDKEPLFRKIIGAFKNRID
jgi:hypothetical protein